MAAPRRRYIHLRDRHAEAVAERCAAEGVEAKPLLRQPLRPFRYIAAVDPSPNKAFLQRVLHWYLAGKFRIEDARTVRRTLVEFRAVARRLPVGTRDINRHASPGDVAAALARFRGENAEISIGEVPPAVLLESDVTSAGDGWTLIEITGYSAAAWWARPTSWCTRELTTYDSYARRSPLRIMLTPTGRVQFHAASRQIMDRFDRPVTPESAGWPKEARDAAAAAVARDLTGDDAEPVVPIAGGESLLHLLAGLPQPRMREPWNAIDGSFGDNVTSWLARGDDGLVLLALSDGALHIRRMDVAGGAETEADARVYRKAEDWPGAPEADRRALALVAGGPGTPRIPARASIEILALVRRDADLTRRVVAADRMADAASLERRIDLLACAARFPDILGDDVGWLAHELVSQGMADAVATSLTTIFGRGSPIVEAVVARASPAARRLVGSIAPAWLDVHPLTWTETHHPAEPASKAADAHLDRHFSGEGLSARMMPYRFVRRAATAQASAEDLIAVMDGIRDAIGPAYRRVQRGYLAASLPPGQRDEALYHGLAGGGHGGLLAAAPLDQLPVKVLRDLSRDAETPVILDIDMLTESAALALGELGGIMWDSEGPAAGKGSPAERAMVGFANSFLRHRRSEWVGTFVRAHALAFGRYDAAPHPDDERAKAAADRVSGRSWLLRADHIAGIAAIRLRAAGRPLDRYYEPSVRLLLLANPAMALATEWLAPSIDRALRQNSVGSQGNEGDEDLRAELLARDWRFVRRMTRNDVHSNQWQFLISRYMADAWRRGDIARRNAIASAYLRLGLGSIAPATTGAEFRAWVLEQDDAPTVDGRPMRTEDIHDRDERAAVRSAVVANRFGALAGLRWLLRAALVAARKAAGTVSRLAAEAVAERVSGR